jgi:IS5 family transposase
LAVRSFLRLAVDDPAPDHTTISRTRRRIAVETHREVFTWVQQRLVAADLLTGKTIAIDATTLEANAAMRSIVRRDTAETYQEFLTQLAKASGIETPTRDDLARLDRTRKKKTSNKDWTHPWDPDAKVTKMKDGRTHLAHKAEHAVDLETGAVVAVTLQGADEGDTTTIIETAIAAAEQLEDAQAEVDEPQRLDEIIADKGYHSNQTMVDLEAVGIRSYIAEPDRGRRDWSKAPDAQAPVYGNRRRIRGRRGRRLMRSRGERIERSFAHVYDTGGMRRTHLRGHTNILKRLLIHVSGFNLGLIMRHLIGVGTARGLQDRRPAVIATLLVLLASARRHVVAIGDSYRVTAAMRDAFTFVTIFVNWSAATTYATGFHEKAGRCQARMVTIDSSGAPQPWLLLMMSFLRTCASGGPADRTTWLPFALVMSRVVDSVPVGVLFCGPVLPAASRSLYRTGCHDSDPPVGAVTGVRFRSVAPPTFVEVKSQSRVLRGWLHAEAPHRVVGLLSDPDPMHHHDELARHRHHRTFLGILAAAARQAESPAAQRRVPSKGTHDVLRTLRGQPADQRVARFGNAQLGRSHPGVALFRLEPEIASDIATPLEARPIVIQDQHERDGRQRAHAMDRLNRLGLGICPRFLHHQPVVRRNLVRQGLDQMEQGQQCRLQRLRTGLGRLPRKRQRGRRGQSVTRGLHHAAHRIDDLCARLNGHLASPDQREIDLRLSRPRMNRREERRPHERELGQQARIGAIVLGIALGNQSQLARIRHQHLMAERGQQSADPGRMRTSLQGDAHPPFALEQDAQRCVGGLDLALCHDVAVAIQYTVVAAPVAHIQAHDRVIPRRDRRRAGVRWLGLCRVDVD